jgi:AsmA protein
VLGGILALLVVVLVVAVFALDRILLSRARAEAAALSSELGRPVTIGGLRTKLLGGLGVRITELEVGPAAGEERSLATLARAEVEADLVRAIRTGGKEVHVREAVLQGLRVSVIRLADGTTNAQRFAEALERRSARGAAPEKRPEPAQPSDLSFLRVGRAAVEDARIAFLDRATPGAREVAIDDLDLEIRDLAAGRPLEVLLRAAVLAERQNLELRLGAAPLPPSLVPTPVTLVLKAQPIDLAPLAPFVPASAGFLGGRFEADLDAALGAAVPGGAGPTKVRGGFRATSLRFRDQAGGRPLDVVLDSDLEADVGAGDLRIAKLQLDAGPARIVGKGRVAGFTGASPRVEGLELVGSGLDPEALAAYYPPLRKQVGGRVAGPIGFSLRGAGGADAQQLELRMDLAPVRLAIAETAAKAAGAPLLLVARARASGADRPIAFEADVDARGVDLRPGGSLAKKPGDPLAAKLAGTYRKVGAEQHVEVSRLEADVMGDRLTGKARAKLAGTKGKPITTFDAELEAPRLDLDRLLLPAPAPAKEKPEEEKPADPAAFAGLSGEARVRIGALRAKRLEARNVLARVKLQEDEVSVEEGRLDVFGGSVSAAGTKLHLARKDAPFRIVADLKNLAADQGLAMLWDRKVVAGTLDGKLELAGAKLEPGAIAQAATGAIAGALKNGSFLGLDLVAAITRPLAARLPFGASALGEGGATALGKELGFAFQLDGGTARLSKPLRAQRAEGDLALEGGVRLDGTLDMPGTLQLSPALVTRLTGGRAKPTAPIPITFRLTGPAWRPAVADLALDAAVQAIVKQAAAGALGRALGDKVPGGDPVAAVEAQKAEAQARLEQEKQAAEARAREEAERQRQRLEKEAQDRLKGLFGR